MKKFLLIIGFTLSVFTFPMLLSMETVESLSKKTITLDTLPSDALGTILCQLTAIIGTPNLKNRKDLNVVVKNIKHLACVNKALNKAINNNAVTNQLLHAVAKRFKMTPLEAAVTINTQSARYWLEKYVQETGEYALFKQVQKLHALALEAVEEVKEQGLIISITDGRDGSPHPSRNIQTKQGLFLVIDSYPTSLYTPWGQIELLRNGFGSDPGFLAISQAFLRKVQAIFDHTESEVNKIYKIIGPIKNSTDLEKYRQCISSEEAKALNGQEILVVSDFSLYKLNGFSAEVLPAAEFFISEREYRSDKVIEALWKIMMELYRKELGTTFALAEYTKQMDQHIANLLAKKEIIDKKACAECKNGRCSLKCSKCKQHYCSKNCQVNNWPLHKGLCFAEGNNPLKELSHKIHTIDDIPAWLTCLVNLLYSQPLFNGKGPKEYKVLPLDDWKGCKLCEVLNDYAEKLVLGRTASLIRAFSCGLYTYSGKPIEQGVKLSYDSHPLCDLSTLKNAYTEVISKIKKGWSLASLVKYKDIFHKESEEEWQLLVKSEYLPEEDTLIYCMADKCGLANKIICSTRMKNKSNREILYVWVKKEALKQFIHAFGCQFV